MSSIPIQELHSPVIDQAGIRLLIKREDLIHPTISGNKWRKLKYNLGEAKRTGQQTLLTFGGAYSNHITAVAAAGKEKGFKTIGIIRGEELERAMKNTSLEFAAACGMKLVFVSREEYRKKSETDFIASLHDRFGNFYLLPEGGSNALAVKGCMEITGDIPFPFQYICTPCGTGATLAGISLSLLQEQHALGFSVLNAEGYHEREVELYRSDSSSIQSVKNWSINAEYHFGGFAKSNPSLDGFINDFIKINQIPIEPVYSGKMFYGIYDLIRKGFFKKGSTVVAVHTGGVWEKFKV